MMRVFVAILVLFVFGSVASAGDALLHRGNEKLKLACNGTGCYSTVFVNGKAGKRVRLGNGGFSNYSKWKAKYHAQGWR